jgi:hypothetical protein
MKSGHNLRQAIDRGLSRIETVAPIGVAYADWLDPRKHCSWGGPMNGQPGRRQIVRDIAAAVGPHAVVETGTYRGTTTQFLWNVTGAPVWSAEVNERFAAFARWRFLGIPEVTVSVQDSRAFLRELAGDKKVPKSRALFYLDAHWSAEDLPLRDEISTVLGAWTNPIIIVDDFEVPGDSGYGFDDYGPDKKLTLSYLPRHELEGFVTMFPTLPSTEEGGERRGCVVIADGSDAAEMIARGVPLRVVS